MFENAYFFDPKNIKLVLNRISISPWTPQSHFLTNMGIPSTFRQSEYKSIFTNPF